MAGLKTLAAAKAGRTLHRHKVKAAPTGKTERTVKRSTNEKLGDMINKGPWIGFPIHTLTLEERATCPAPTEDGGGCRKWEICYGNNMRNAIRYEAGPVLMANIEQDLTHYQKRHPTGFAVRLHILGDFWSVGYVAFWARMLTKFPALHVWGYTARLPGTDIGDAVHSLNLACPERWVVRFSDLPGDAYPSALGADMPEAQEMLALKQAFVCPEQTGKAKTCGDCGACWVAAKPVIFILH